MHDHLRFRATPIAGESLLGFLWRIAARNRISISALHGMAGNWHKTNTPLPGMVERLAILTGVPTDVLNSLSYRVEDKRSAKLEGHLVPRYLLAWEPRRVCPDCLTESLHHRAVWDVSLVAACPVHGRILALHCDTCERPLEWLGDDPWKCACGQDFRRIQTPLVPSDDLIGTGFVYGLLGQPGGTEERRSSAPFRDLSVGEALDLLRAMAMTRPAMARWGLVSSRVTEGVHLTVDEAFKACETWPVRLPEFIRASADRVGDPLRLWADGLLPRSPDSEQAAKDVLLALEMAVVRPASTKPINPALTLQEAAVMLGITEARLSRLSKCFSSLRADKMGRRTLDQEEVEAFVATRQGLVTARQAAAMLDVSATSFQALVLAGLIRDVTGTLMSSVAFGVTDIRRFLTEVAAGAVVDATIAGDDEVRVGDKLRSVVLTGGRIVTIVTKIINGTIRCVRIDDTAVGLRRYVLSGREVEAIFTRKT